MIKNVKLFVNKNDESIKTANIIRDKLFTNGFVVNDREYDLAIAIGGDGTFLRMVKNNNFNSDIYYVGINSGTLGFLQEVKLIEIDKFIMELRNNKYKIEEIGIQETNVCWEGGNSKFYSLNEIIIRDRNLKVVRLNISINGDLVERFLGDGVLIASSVGSTAHNLSYGGSIVFNTFTSLQLTPMGPLNSKTYRSLVNSIIIPDKMEVEIIPECGDKALIVTIDGENKFYDKVSSITTKIDGKKIKCLRLSHYNFPQKINEKLLMD